MPLARTSSLPILTGSPSAYMPWSHARRPEAVHRLITHLCQRVRHHARRVPLVPVLRQGHHVQRDLLARLLPTTHKPRVQHLHEHEAVAVPVQQRVSARERVQQAQVDPAARLRELVDHRQRAHLRPDGCHLRSSGGARARARAKPASAACARGVKGSACAVFVTKKTIYGTPRPTKSNTHALERPTEVERCSPPGSTGGRPGSWGVASTRLGGGGGDAPGCCGRPCRGRGACAVATRRAPACRPRCARTCATEKQAP